MGIWNILYSADVGTCSYCETKYVTRAAIALDDSHFMSHDTYACPNCKKNNPKDIVKDVKDEDRKFAMEQLKVELDVNPREKSKLVLIASELD